jgi:hypothetical protein
MVADLLEFESTLKRQGSVLCLPVGKSLELALRRHGFQSGQSVILRFAVERLEIRPRNTPEEIRDKLLSAAEEIRSFKARMLAFARDLPQVSDEELEEAENLEGELLGMLECLVADDLDPAIAKLESVTRLGPPPADEPPAQARRPGRAAKAPKPRPTGRT